MNVLLTGATGFVGGHILDVLEERNMNVRIILRRKSSLDLISRSNIEDIIISENLFLETNDKLFEAMKDIDVVIHSAWYAEPGHYLNSNKNLECLSGTLEIAKAAAKARIKKFISLGTCFEYAESSKPLSIDALLSPKTLYAATKVSTFYSLQSFFKEEKIDFSWCRLFYLYGEREDPRRFVPYIRNQLLKGEMAQLSSGDQVRDYMNVSDAANIIVDLVSSNLTGPVNVCSGHPITIKEFACMIAEELEAKHLLRFGERQLNLTDPAFMVGVPNY